MAEWFSKNAHEKLNAVNVKKHARTLELQKSLKFAFNYFGIIFFQTPFNGFEINKNN